jgi:hypothetical protein
VREVRQAWYDAWEVAERAGKGAAAWAGRAAEMRKACQILYDQVCRRFCPGVEKLVRLFFFPHMFFLSYLSIINTSLILFPFLGQDIIQPDILCTAVCP